MEIIDATKAQIVEEIPKIQDGDHIIFTDGYVTQRYLQKLLQKRGFNAELKLIGDAINFLIRRGICTLVLATTPDDFDRLAFKKLEDKPVAESEEKKEKE